MSKIILTEDCVCLERDFGSDLGCSSIDPETKMICTREKGHEGKHVACGVSKHKIAEWK